MYFVFQNHKLSFRNLVNQLSLTLITVNHIYGYLIIVLDAISILNTGLTVYTYNIIAACIHFGFRIIFVRLR